jgi:hypothetical protein
MKLPSFQFYPGDWQKDPNLRRCSHAAKGVLMDILCLMFESEERGVLISGGVPWTIDETVLCVGGNADVTLSVTLELLSKGVLHRRADGAIFSKRMVKDEEERKKGRIRVKKHRQNGENEECNGDVTGDVTPVKQPPSSSSSSSDIGNTYTQGAGPTSLANKFAVPATEKEAVEWAAAAGVPPDFAKSLYHQCEGRGWVDGSGARIQMWSSYAKSRHLREAFQKPNQQTISQNQNGSKSSGTKAPSVFELKTAKEAKESLMASLKNKYCGEGLSGWSDDGKRREYNNLKREVEELTKQLAKAA